MEGIGNAHRDGATGGDAGVGLCTAGRASSRPTAAFHQTMHCYLCHVESGHLEQKEHEAAKWLGKDERSSVNWLPADWELVKKQK